MWAENRDKKTSLNVSTLRDLDPIEAHRIAKTATRKEEERRKKGGRLFSGDAKVSRSHFFVI